MERVDIRQLTGSEDGVYKAELDDGIFCFGTIVLHDALPGVVFLCTIDKVHIPIVLFKTVYLVE